MEVKETRKVTFPGFESLAGREAHEIASGDWFFSLLFDKQFKFMFSCLLEVRFAGVLLKGTAVSLLSYTATSGFDESASGRFREGVIERVCNASTNDCY
jgi:hypothetical protein